jgi:hypothetical protein
MGESATAMGRGRAVGPMPASRPTGRSGLGYPLALEWRNLRLNCQWHTTTTASHCKGQRRCQYLSRCEAVTGPWISGHTDACIVRVGARRDRFSTIDKRGRRCLREPAHGLGEWPRALARRGRRLPDLRISAPSVVACILAQARDATDFRPSMNGVGGACASRRTVWESSRERWCDGAGCYRTLGFRPPRSLHAYWRGRATRPIFEPSINGVGGACASCRMVWGSGRERWRGGAGRLPDLNISAPIGHCMHVGAGARRDRFSTIDERGRRCLREPAHGLGEWPRALARRGGLLPDLRISAPSVVACILARACDATDFRTGVGSACASRRTA